MNLPGIRSRDLNIPIRTHGSSHEQLRAQDLSRGRADQSQHRRNCGASGARERRLCSLCERRGGAPRPPSFDQGPAPGVAGIGQTRRLSRHPEARLSVRLLGAVFSIVLVFLTACGGHKQAKAPLPPPPAVSEPETEDSAKSSEPEISP